MNIIFNLLVYITWFFATYYTVYFFLTYFVHRNKVFENKPPRDSKEFITILVPAFNEEKGIVDTINSLKQITYKHVEFIILNDGSSDKTSNLVTKHIEGDSRFIFVDNKHNQGKATVLNEGIEMAKGKFIACIDADSIVEPDALQKIIPYFDDAQVGAVTASIQVRNPKNLIHKIVAVEFSLGLSLFLKLFSFLDCVFVTPGPFSMYRKDMLLKIGKYDSNNITEDHEIAFRIHKHGYKIRSCMEAKCYTTLPDTFKGIYIQRRRWYAGSIQTIVKHRSMAFDKRYSFFAYYIPYHFFLIGLGLLTFVTSLYLIVKKFSDYFGYYSYTNFNFFEHLKWNVDFLTYGQVNIIGLSMILATILLLVVGTYGARKRLRDNRLGSAGYLFLFFLYQIFWIGAIAAVLRNRKIKWK